ncbi:MAG TPA: arginine deiminase-related protein, partial [Gallionellaceae bacterium]|nr:arginine deiminase-related protein [Gallionellaceae bacterium]
DMQTFLMCKPDHFEVSYVINPWMAGNLGKVDKALATKQWQQLHDLIVARAHIQLIAPQPGLPDMVFTANAGLVTHDHRVIVATFLHRERQGETPYFRNFFLQHGYHDLPLSRGIVLEGAGDALFDAAGRLWLAAGIRSQHTASDEVTHALGIAVHSLTLVDPRWYHLDTAFCPLSNGEALAYRKAFSADSIRKIEHAFGEAVLWVSDDDATDFACNAINIGRDIILYRASPALKATLAARGYNVIEVDVSEFMKSGGSCKCLTLAL